jgi:DNA-binding transcriptional LysR family regulator
MDNRDLNAVRTFAEVVRSGSFAAAARRLGMPRSTVSLRIRNLEQAIGVRLFKRSTRAIVLTSEGQALYDGASAALDTVAETMTSIGAAKGELKGPIRFTAPSDFPTDLLAEAIGTFRAMQPKVTFEVVLSNTLLDLVADNIDIALRIGIDNQQDTVTRRAVIARYGFFASPSYLESFGEPAKLDDIGALIAPSRELREYLELQVLGGAALGKPAIEANNFLLIRDLALAGCGVGLLPVRVCAQDVSAGLLRQTLGNAIVGSVSMSLSFPTRADMSDRVKAFADHLVRYFTHNEG